jgi:hypothetical protein
MEEAMSVTFYAGQIEGPNLSNRNAGIVLHAIGIDNPDITYGEMPVTEFLNRCQNWLRANIGKRSQELLTTIDGNFIDCGLPEGYLNSRIHELCCMAQEGRDQCAATVSWG